MLPGFFVFPVNKDKEKSYKVDGVYIYQAVPIGLEQVIARGLYSHGHGSPGVLIFYTIAASKVMTFRRE